jgi:uncharacterized SAM-binding protein YcdF (DUF218 family)
MLKGHNIICISSIDWDFVWQGHQEIMSAFANSDNRVLFIENTGVRTPTLKDIPRLKKRLIDWFKSVKGFRQEMENLFVYSPIFLPFPYSRITRWINKYMILNPLRKWMKTMKFYEPIIWTFLPTGIALDIIDSIDKKLLVYYCIADFYELVGSPKKVRKTENELIKKSDLIFAQGSVLGERCRCLNNRVYTFPFGVKMETFENFQHSSHNFDKVPPDLRGIRRPIIGYVGGIHRHIDFGLVRYIAKTQPEWSITLIGPIQTNISEISNLANVFFLGKKDFSSLPHYISQFDVGIVPYNVSEYTQTVFPTKLNEYHAMGKPVVSTELPEIASFNAENNNLVLVGRTYKEFVDCVVKALKSKSDGLANLRIASARKNSWTTRIEKMSNLLEDAVEKKSRGPFNWQESFLKFYRTSRRKIFNIVIIVLGIYLLVFYTPLVWFMAEPLKISQAPEKADCIVVFAGGVGESGKAGQGYEERVEYAAKLYSQGYADHLIFSSGYMYVFKEPLIMKALAISLGVPEEAIILEDKAKNTYENVNFTKKILASKGWNKILLVSSPYHMQRVSLVIKKVAQGIKIIYTPIPKSRFYSHNIRSSNRRRWKQVKVQQIRGLVHEYLGIIYYWWKGYI